MSSDMLYKMSLNIANLLYIYLNGTEKRFPMNFFSFFQKKSTQKTLIINFILCLKLMMIRKFGINQ